MYKPVVPTSRIAIRACHTNGARSHEPAVFLDSRLERTTDRRRNGPCRPLGSPCADVYHSNGHVASVSHCLCRLRWLLAEETFVCRPMRALDAIPKQVVLVGVRCTSAIAL